MPRQHEDSELRENGVAASPVKHGEEGENVDAVSIAWLGLSIRYSEGECVRIGVLGGKENHVLQ